MTRLPSRNWESPGVRFIAALALVGAAACALAEPVVERVGPDGPLVIGKPATFECIIRWPSDEGPWLVQPADFEKPGWANLETVKWTAKEENGENVLVQTFSVEPLEAGGHEIPAIEFRISLDQAFQPAETQIPQSPNAPTLNALRVPPFPVEVKPHTTPNWVSAGLPLIILALAASVSAWYVVRKRARRRSPVSETAREKEGDTWRAELQRRRIEGDIYGFYRRLAELTTDPALREQFGTTADAVGFKGEKVSPDRLDQDLRALQRNLEQAEGRNHS